MRQATDTTALFLYRCSVTPNRWGEPGRRGLGKIAPETSGAIWALSGLSGMSYTCRNDFHPPFSFPTSTFQLFDSVMVDV